MGFDTIELVLEIEDEFKIDIPDHAAAQIRTVGDIHQYLVDRLAAMPAVTCRSATFFYQLRSALHATFGTERSRVQLDAPIAELVGRRNACFAWFRLERQLGFRLPGLAYPMWRQISLALGTLLFVAIPIYVWRTIDPPYAGCALVAFLVAFSLMFYAWSAVTRLFGRIPIAGVTVRGTVETVAPSWPATGEDVDPAAVWSGLRRIVSDQLGIAQEKIVPESRFVEDLGCD